MAPYEEHPINARTLPRIIAEKVPNPWHIDQLHEALNDSRTGLMDFGSCRVLDLYCYLRAGARTHEFLLARILLHQRDVWARLEREPDTSARSPLSGRTGYPALDQIRLSNSDEKLKTPKDKLDVHCGFPSLRLYHLVDCVKLVHDETFNYDWSSTNCWWFSSIVVDTLHVYGDYHKKPPRDMVKQLINLLGKDTTDARHRIQDKFRGHWTDPTTARPDLSTAREVTGSLVKKIFRRSSSPASQSSGSTGNSLLSSAGLTPRLCLRLREDIIQPIPSASTQPTISLSLQISHTTTDNGLLTPPAAVPLPASPVGSEPSSDSEDEGSQVSSLQATPSSAPPAYADLPPSIQHWATKKPRVSKLCGHTEGIYCVDVVSDKIITGSRDTCVKVWSSTSYGLLATLRGHVGSVLCVRADAENGFLASGSSDGGLLVWNLGTLENTSPVHRISAHHENVLEVILSPDYIFSSGRDKTMKIWSRNTFTLLWSSVGHRASVNAIDVSPVSNRIVTASGDKTLVLWEITSQGLSQVRTFSGHTRGVACVKFLPLRSSEPLPVAQSSGSTLQGTDNNIRDRGEELFASGSGDRSIRIWRANTGECLRTLEGHTDLVRDLLYDARGGLLVSGSWDSTIVFWQLQLADYLFPDPARPNDSGSDEKLRVFKRYGNRVFGLAVNGHQIICAGAKNNGYVFDFS